MPKQAVTVRKGYTVDGPLASVSVRENEFGSIELKQGDDRIIIKWEMFWVLVDEALVMWR